MKKNNTPVVKDLVLVGGGHAHVAVLRMFAMKPVPGLRITLITRDIHTPYSGMLPGLVAGHYDYDDCHIDLGPLARFAGARLYHTEVEGLDLDNKKIMAHGRPPVSYDLLSINTGSRPSAVDVPGVDEYAIAAKPIDIFLLRWEALVKRIQNSIGEFRLIVVGGGAGGVEIALSTQFRLRELLSSQGDDPGRISVMLLTKGIDILPTHNRRVRESFLQVLKQRNITVHTEARVVEVAEHFVRTASDNEYKSDAVLWVTNASAPDWPGEAGLEVDESGFIRVNEYLQSTSHADVFVAGDVASMPESRPKSGVFAVRQGPFLESNLRRSATVGSLRAYKPQRNFLGLISTGDKNAIASRGQWAMQGGWLWTVKDWIDRKFMRMFNVLPDMPIEATPQLASGIADASAIKELSSLAMRCGGCGAKVGATVLSRVMERLPTTRRDDVLIGRDAPDDCAMLSVPQGKVMVQSVDYFRAFIDDNYTFGAIAANHALGDLFAMGAEAQSVLAIATVPYGREAVVEEALYEMLAGALSIIEPTGAVLAGGHSSEGAEMAFGLTVNGLVEPQGVWRKGGMQPGDKLVLTKPVGTGTLFAADMRHKAKGRWVDGAIQSMLISSQSASECLRRHEASACTDLTGFGLVGHLVEMTRASNVDATLYLQSIPLLDGALDTVAMGILSSLQPSNLRLRRAIANIQDVSSHPAYPLLFDPQTAGGLLAAIPAEKVNDCINELHSLGYENSAVIGEIDAQSDRAAPIFLR